MNQTETKPKAQERKSVLALFSCRRYNMENEMRRGQRYAEGGEKGRVSGADLRSDLCLYHRAQQLAAAQSGKRLCHNRGVSGVCSERTRDHPDLELLDVLHEHVRQKQRARPCVHVRQHVPALFYRRGDARALGGLPEPVSHRLGADPAQHRPAVRHRAARAEAQPRRPEDDPGTSDRARRGGGHRAHRDPGLQPYGRAARGRSGPVRHPRDVALCQRQQGRADRFPASVRARDAVCRVHVRRDDHRHRLVLRGGLQLFHRVFLDNVLSDRRGAVPVL